MTHKHKLCTIIVEYHSTLKCRRSWGDLSPQESWRSWQCWSSLPCPSLFNLDSFFNASVLSYSSVSWWTFSSDLLIFWFSESCDDFLTPLLQTWNPHPYLHAPSGPHPLSMPWPLVGAWPGGTTAGLPSSSAAAACRFPASHISLSFLALVPLSFLWIMVKN